MVEMREAIVEKKTKHLNKEERKFRDDHGTQVHTKKFTNVGRLQGKHKQIEYSNPCHKEHVR
jgi:hypothetical protein